MITFSFVVVFIIPTLALAGKRQENLIVNKAWIQYRMESPGNRNRLDVNYQSGPGFFLSFVGRKL